MSHTATDKIKILTAITLAHPKTATAITAAAPGVSRPRALAALTALEADCIIGHHRHQSHRRYRILNTAEQANARNRQAAAANGARVAAALTALGFRATAHFGGTEIRLTTAGAAALLERIAE